MRTRQSEIYVCDFETTSFKGQKYTEVWAAASVKIGTEDVNIFGSIQELYAYFKSLNTNIIAYFHNLKFDGAFWLSFLMCDLKLKQATYKTGNRWYDVSWRKEKDMLNDTFKYSISERGQWYSMTIKTQNKIIEIRDSLKLLPFSVKRIGDSFKTKHRKLTMEYEGFRYAGCNISEEEKEYIANDVLVVKEALEIMFKEGHNKLTIGSCCLSEYKEIVGKSLKIQLEYESMFPDIYSIPIDGYDSANAGEYIRRSYRGGWCYLAKGKAHKIYKNGTTADVNSLYPSVMHSQSGNKYPIGKPIFWKGNYIPDEALLDDRYYFIRIKTRFYLKKGYLPFIQIKNSFLYTGNECLESSDIYDPLDGKYYTHYPSPTDSNKTEDTRVILTLTMTDFELFKEHYNLVDFEILDGCWFYAMIGIFDEYIDKYKQIKITSKGALRELAKLFLNNLYGKLATSTDSSFKYAYIKDDGSIGFVPVYENSKKPGYIPAGSAVTSYARNFTIRAAQKNYHGSANPGFIYADTDSIHCDLPPEQIVGIKVHDTDFCCWKLESCWDEAIFTRQKTYIEHVIMENLKPVEPYYNVKCAGMPDRCKELYLQSLTSTHTPINDCNEEEMNFLYDSSGIPIHRELTDFDIGLEIPGKLLPKRILGGIVLTETTYKMR